MQQEKGLPGLLLLCSTNTLGTALMKLPLNMTLRLPNCMVRSPITSITRMRSAKQLPGVMPWWIHYSVKRPHAWPASCVSDQIKFQLDENVNPAMAAGLRRRGVNVTTSQDLDMLGLPLSKI